MLTTLELPPTTTSARREVRWLAAVANAYTDGRLGTMTYVQSHSTRRGAVVDAVAFAVTELPPLPSGTRRFTLGKIEGPDFGQVYHVSIRAEGGGTQDNCTCLAATKGRLQCRHCIALRALIDDGAL